MTAIHYLVTVNLTICLPFVLIQPERSGRMEPEAHACRGCQNCRNCGGSWGKGYHEEKQF